MFYTHFEGTTVNLNSDIKYILKVKVWNDDFYYFRYVFDDKLYVDILLGKTKENSKEQYIKLTNYKNNIVQYLNTKDEKYLQLNDTLFSNINLKKMSKKLDALGDRMKINI